MVMRFWKKLRIFYLLIFLGACTDKSGQAIKEIRIGLHNDNELSIQIDVVTTEPVETYVLYWPDSIGKSGALTSTRSKNGLQHSLLLGNMLPDSKYSFQVVTVKNNQETTSRIYPLKTRVLPMWLKDQFKYSGDSLQIIPAVFKEGFMLVNKRETPGVAYIVDYKGRIRWYHMVAGTGFKVVHFTKDQTILSILGKNDEPTSYGSEILEINLLGDTVLHLKKGDGDFKQVIHHEIRKNDQGQIITLFIDQRVLDLSSVGGSKKDTVNGDGILILDKQGKKIWQWSVFDVMDPLKDPQLLKTKKDWMHANSLNFDKDSNFIISFYNNGQIWKVNAKTGSVMWKLGKGGSFNMCADCAFNQSHAVHINRQGNLMFFDNGVEKRQSEVFALKLDQEKQTAQLDLHIKLPKDIYNDRMGSAYMINDTSVLCCSSKRKIAVLVNRKGVLLWAMDTAIPPYRVEFLTKEQVAPWLQPLKD
ncbi:MAG: aryl-sulfate sulfotransferase [Chitinophagales bacterium]